MIRLHHLNNSRSQRIVWLLEELALDYELVVYQRDPVTYLAPEALKQIHPLGKAPILEDSDDIVAESAVIIDYLVNKYAPNLRPELGSKEYLSYNYWMHYSEGSLMPYFVINLVFDKLKSSPMPFFVRPIASKIANKAIDSFISPNIRTHLLYINNYLKDRAWFCSEAMTAADVQMIFPLEAAYARGIVNRETYPHIVTYVEKVHSRPKYQAALAVTGDYDYA